MAISYTLNSQPITTVSECQWEAIPNTDVYNNIEGYSPWYRHIWTIQKMRMIDFEFIDGLKEVAIISMDTANQSDPNTVASYDSVRLSSVSGEHIGISMERVRVEFLVKVN